MRDWEQGEGCCHCSWVPWRSLHKHSAGAGGSLRLACGAGRVRCGRSSTALCTGGKPQGVDAVWWNGGGVSKVDNILVGQMYPLATSLQGCARSPGQLQLLRQPCVALSPPRALPAPGPAARAVNRVATGGKSLPGVEQERFSSQLLGSHVWLRPRAA